MIKKLAKSKTILISILMMAMGVIEINFHMMQGLLGDYYGLSFIVMSILMGALRIMTTTAIKDK